jgi:nucleoside-diphosphate-sugar epimerase
MNTMKTALVLGANGGIGGETCLALQRHGWKVRAMVRSPRKDTPSDGIEWVRGDAMVAADVLAAAQGATLIVHAVNPPGYRGWERVVLPMLDNTIAAAKAVGARIVLPGTIYNFGPDAFPRLVESSPQHPATRKGELRVEMEHRLEAAARAGAPCLILRCGDFFGAHSGNNWFSQGLIKPGQPLRQLSYPGPRELEHAWAYLPDVAETMARLVQHADRLDNFAVYHFAGHQLDGNAMLAAVRRVAGNPGIRAAKTPWWLITLAAPFVETLRELRKMRYLWQAPIVLDQTKLHAFLGEVPHTPLDEALRLVLIAAGCLPDPARDGRAPALRAMPSP